MRRKNIFLLLVVALVVTSIVIVPKNIVVKANPSGEGSSTIDAREIYSITQNDCHYPK